MERLLLTLPILLILAAGPRVSPAMGGAGGAGGGTGSAGGSGASSGAGGSGTSTLPPEMRARAPTAPADSQQKRIKYGRE